jgi:hypothetical protein
MRARAFAVGEAAGLAVLSILIRALSFASVDS